MIIISSISIINITSTITISSSRSSSSSSILGVPYVRGESSAGGGGALRGECCRVRPMEENAGRGIAVI